MKDRTGRVWVQTEQELAVWQNGAFQVKLVETNEGNFHVDIGSSHAGGVWVAANGRLRQFDSGGWGVDFGPYKWTNSPIYDLYEDSLHQLWVATMGSGLFRFSPDGTVLRLTTKNGMPSDFVRCVTEDREGSIWVGTESGGLCRLKRPVFQALKVPGLASDQVTSACESTNDNFWIGMDGEGVDYLSSTGLITHFGPSQGLMNGHVWSVVRDERDAIYVGTWDGLYECVNGKFRSLSDGVRIGRQIFAIYQDPQGDLWLGQQGFGALTRLHGDEPTVVRIPGASSSLDVRVMVQDARQNLWVGTVNEGLYCYQDSRWIHFGKTNGLGSDTVWSLNADDDGLVWIGTCGGGLSCWKEGQIRTWTTKDGLPNDVICQILEDDQDNLWLGSYDGVFRVDKKQLKLWTDKSPKVQCVAYDKSDGMPSIECMGGFQPAGLKSRNGQLWFPTVKGFAKVNPHLVPHNALRPPVKIEGALVDGTRCCRRKMPLTQRVWSGIWKFLPENNGWNFDIRR